MSKPHPGELSLLPAFIWKTMWAVSLKIRSGLAEAGACQGANCLDPRWVYTTLCSDRCLLCLPEKPPLFSFTPSLPQQTTEFGRLKITSLVKLKALPPPSCCFSSCPGKAATVSPWGLESLCKERRSAVFTIAVVIFGAACACPPWESLMKGVSQAFQGAAELGGQSWWLGLLRLVLAYVSVWQQHDKNSVHRTKAREAIAG